MAFHVKTDFCGLIAATTVDGNVCLEIRDDNPNETIEKYQPLGQDGSIVATEIYGKDSAPTNNYTIKMKITATAGMIKLGNIVSITKGSGSTAVTKKYALEKVSITTGGGQVPTLFATCQEVEADASGQTMPYYSIPAFVLGKEQVTQDIFSAFSITGTGCHLTKASYEFSCTINKDKVAGTKISSDINTGLITAKGTILQTGSTEPTVSVNSENTSGWVFTHMNRKNPETAYQEWEFEMQLALAKTYPTVNQGGGSN